MPRCMLCNEEIPKRSLIIYEDNTICSYCAGCREIMDRELESGYDPMG